MKEDGGLQKLLMVAVVVVVTFPAERTGDEKRFWWGMGLLERSISLRGFSWLCGWTEVVVNSLWWVVGRGTRIVRSARYSYGAVPAEMLGSCRRSSWTLARYALHS